MYHHYFYSGVSGSGLAIFSFFPIVKIFHHRFRPNGKPYKIFHADWFGGKVVGCCRISHPILGLVDIHTTHLHAEYHRENDEYLPHRICQTYQMIEFIKTVAASCVNPDGSQGLVILAGDLNFEPSDISYLLCKEVGHFIDVWSESKPARKSVLGGDTCDAVDNFYTKPKSGKKSKRIDYIFQVPLLKNRFQCVHRNVCMKYSEPEKISFSDHFGVDATFQLVDDSKILARKFPRHLSALKDAFGMVKLGLTDSISRRRFSIRLFYVAIILLGVCLLLTLFKFLQDSVFSCVLVMLLTFLSMFYFYLGYIFGNEEVNELRATAKEMEATLLN
eukprot:Sdes_comp20832_c0_seq2m17436